MMDRDEARLIEETNALLRLTGFGDRTFKTVPELVASVSSMSVALYERLFELRLENVVREPKTIADYSENAQRVVDALAAAMLSDDLANVTGVKVCTGDLAAIRDLVRVLTHVYQMLRRSQRNDDASSESDRSLHETYYIKRSKKPTASKRAKRPPDDETGLLTTQAYGRYVPMPSASSSTRSSRRASVASASSASSSASSRNPKPSQTRRGSPPSAAFGSVSSVSFTGSEKGELDDTSIFSFHPDDEDEEEHANATEGPGDENEHVEPDESDTPLPLPLPVHAAEHLRKASPPPAPVATAMNRSGDRSSLPAKLRLEDMLSYGGVSMASSLRTSASALPPKRLQPQPLLGATERLHQARYKAVLSDHVHSLRHREKQEHDRLGRALQQQQHTQQVERIRAIKIHHELRRQRISLGLDQKRVEEKHLKQTMDSLLEMERERVRQEHEATAAALHTIQQDHKKKEAALETFYAHQMELAKEQREREVHDRSLLEHAHRLASEKLLRETRLQREKELQEIMAQRQHLAQVQQFRQERRLDAYMVASKKATPVLHLDVQKKVKDPFHAAAMQAKTARTTTYSRSNVVRRIYGSAK
ncbi:hypothetical protein SDRG_02345 [Saprolegnia diclina VS20]|uniref:DUF5745 domain-containing protein n=1 Tax=Saprolegnia diclina (strain VS20) TaxID=1156394 RepID=T0QQS8_SAPDV|nr:hypothetical protein SDRG_02345 [Saprolegnia diclina VS20]EQC40449.1 hypothetical protein SDRG_02345 [Saprolegnia diclina VS20]|eukprot:XP_008606148.1 hypothetical protein SDRG_02345 [Saprolegnia diclina VS20]